MSARSKKSGLGNALRKNRNKSRAQRRAGKGGGRHSAASDDEYDNASSHDLRARKYDSVIERNDLEEFMAVAEMANRDFAAERGIGLGNAGETVTIVVDNTPQVYEVDSTDNFSLILRDQRKTQQRVLDMVMPMPRRPAWSKDMTRRELNENEKKSFLDWRRSLALKEQEMDIVVTPYEKNLEMWRQLWRTVERSHVVVQIVDARNPLAFHSKDLEDYVHEVSPKKRNLLVLNKADLLSKRQRFRWAQYLRSRGIEHVFFSAHIAQHTIDNSDDEELLADIDNLNSLVDGYVNPAEKDVTHVFNRVELLQYFRSMLSGDILQGEDMQQEFNPNNLYQQRRIVIGMVGYPNVGKSSVVNVLCGRKRVAVASTPGKTKYIQTIPIGKHILLCDCPGLVFPSVSTTKQDMVVDGIMPIDQMRDYRAPVALLCSRIPMRTFELIYGMRFDEKMRNPRRRNAPLTVDELLSAFARSKGMMAQKGVPNYHAAARLLLKDYVSGKLLYCHPPPDFEDGDGNDNDADAKDDVTGNGLEEGGDEEEGEVEVVDYEDALADDDEYFTEDEEGDDDDDDDDVDGNLRSRIAAATLGDDHDDYEEVDRLNDYSVGKPRLDETKELTDSQRAFNEDNVHAELLREREMRRQARLAKQQPEGRQLDDLYDEPDEIVAGVIPSGPSGFGTKGVSPDFVHQLANVANRDEIIKKARQMDNLTMDEKKKLKMLKRRHLFMKKMG